MLLELLFVGQLVNQQVLSRKCSGFKVQGYNTSEIIDLPVVFSRPDIPINRNDIPKPNSFATYSHLKDISSRLSYFPDIEVGLLIGYNCSQASIPVQVVLGSNTSEPYAVQTPLGWTIIGSTSKSSSVSSVPHRASLDPLNTAQKIYRNVNDTVPTATCFSLLTRFSPSSTHSTSYYALRYSPRRKFDSSSSIQTLRKKHIPEYSSPRSISLQN